MKCFLDSNVLDWIADDPSGPHLIELARQGRISVVVGADNAHEIERIPNAKASKRTRLQDLVRSHFAPVAATHVPLLGIARLGAARLATWEVLDHRQQLKGIGITGLDSNHLINAAREKCQAFITLDKGVLRKSDGIRSILGLACLDPATLLDAVAKRVASAG